MKLAPLPKDKVIPCLNCGVQIHSSHRFCKNCGQKIEIPRLSFFAVLGNIFSSIFNLDSKFFQTVGNLWRPAKMTRSFIAGERAKYMHPGRVFIVSFFILSAVFSIYFNTLKDQLTFDGIDNKFLHEGEFRQDLLNVYDSLSMEFPVNPVANMDSIRQGLFFSKAQIENDSIESLGGMLNVQYDDDIGLTDINSDKAEQKFATHDILYLDKEAFLEKYKIEGFFNRLKISQYLKFLKDPAGSGIFMVTSTLWTLVLSIFFLAFAMKILYIRRFYYYVEHLILLMNIHSFMFLMLAIGLLLLLINSKIGSAWNCFAIFMGLVLMYFSLKSYYKQYRIITFIKMNILLVAYCFIASICLIFVMMASMALF